MDYYKILEITEDASPEVIKAAYKALAKKYHPDTFGGDDAEREKNMSDLNEAYSVLSDVTKRKTYDMQRNREKQEDGQKKSCQSNYQETSNDKTDDENKKGTSEKESKLGRFASAFGKEILSTIQNNNREMENAFLEGMTMDEYTLVRRFKRAKGFKRAGYANALEKKGLLERNSEGRLIPTYRFKFYL